MKKIENFNKAFSLIELSIVILIIGILIAGVTQGSRLINQLKLSTAQSLTRSSDVNSILDLAFWVEPTLDSSFTNSSGSFQVDNGGSISSWNDIKINSSTKINVSQSNTSIQPTYQTNGINNLPAVSFNGIDQYLINNSNFPISKSNKTYTMVLVWRANTLSAPSDSRLLMGQGLNPFDYHRQSLVVLSNLGVVGFSGWANYYYPASVNANAAYATIIVVNNTLSSNNLMIYNNSNTPSIGSSTNPSVLDIGAQLFFIGGVNSSLTFSISYCFSGLISEAMVFDRNLKSEEVKTINNYLGKKYGIKII